MGIDCSGFMQVIFKTNGIVLPRDSKDQANYGNPVDFEQHAECDLVFFSRPEQEQIVHVGMVVEKGKLIHAGSSVRMDELNKDGLILDGILKYKTATIRRMIS